MNTLVFSTPEAVGKAAAVSFATLYHHYTTQNGVFKVALSGGSTPVHLYAALRTMVLDWSKVEFYFSDERTVLPTSEQSNYHLAKVHLLDHVSGAQVYRIQGEQEPHEAAAQYAQHLPRLDLCYLGMGDDGHTASLFPETAGLDSSSRVLANWVEKLGTWRITLSFAEINHSHNVHILATGANKAKVWQEVRERQGKHPIEQVSHALWFLDEGIASS